jgi:hypothetical protein
MPRGRPDPFGQVADGGRVHLVPGLEILEQDRAQLDEPQRRLASGDDGVHAGAVAVVGANATVAIAIEGGSVTAIPAVPFTGDQIDEGGIFGLLQWTPSLYVAGTGVVGSDRSGGSGDPAATGFWHSIRGQSPLAKGVLFHVPTGTRARPAKSVSAGRHGASCGLGRLEGDGVGDEGAKLMDDGIGDGHRVAHDRARGGR